MSFSMRTNGKLLLTGEYFVTEGAVALALPTQLGQSLNVNLLKGTGEPTLIWKSYSSEQKVWFEATYSLPDLNIAECNGDDDKDEVAESLQNTLRQAQSLNPDFLDGKASYEAAATLEFARDWGLGSSSTLITMIAKWALIDPFLLLKRTFGGSGYDIVAATAEGPMLFQKFNGKNRWEKSNFNPAFKEHLYFVYLEKKQNTREALVYYMISTPEERGKPLPRITQITHDIAQYTRNLEDFDDLIAEHEDLVKSVIHQPRAKEVHFSDFWGEVKSLGGWGGDFVLVTSNRSEEDTKEYFKSKGFNTVFKYQELVKEY